MANRDFNKIKRTIQDFSLGVGEGGSTSGGMVIVDTLPEVGDPNLLYKLPDGKIWSCVNKTETRIISDLEVGKSFKLSESIPASDYETLGAKVELDDSVRFECSSTSYIEIYKDSSKLDVDYCLGTDLEDPSWVRYTYNYAEPVENVEASLEFFEELPEVEITQTFVDSIAETSYKLEDFIPLFQNSSHTEEVTESTWTQLGGGAPKLYLHRIYLGNPTECDRIDFTMNIYNSRPEPYTDIHDLEAYLISAGLNNTAEEIETYENHNGIICARDAYSSSSETIILRKIDEHYWYFRVGQYDNSYLGINIWEDSVMTM